MWFSPEVRAIKKLKVQPGRVKDTSVTVSSNRSPFKGKAGRHIYHYRVGLSNINKFRAQLLSCGILLYYFITLIQLTFLILFLLHKYKSDINYYILICLLLWYSGIWSSIHGDQCQVRPQCRAGFHCCR